MIRKVVILCLICIMSACSITPKPLTTSDRYQESIKDLKELFAQQEPMSGKLDFYQALARGLKYNLDYRIKRVNSALQAGQLDVAIYTMFPALNTSGSIYNRNNEYASSGITTTGAPTDILNSTPNTVRSARVALSWNILDFGLGYVKAKQQGERYLIAQEEARKQIQQLSQDVLIAYWSAYSAQELMMEASEFESILNNAKKKLSAAMRDNTIPKQSILDYEGALLDGNRHIIQLQYKYDKAILDLKHLLNLPPGLKLTLTEPPLTLRNIHDLSKLDFRKVDALTLVNRPELRGQNYQQRIAKWGVKTVILQSLPGITLNEGWNYNSNEFLLNTMWVDRSVDLAWNLLNVASLPASFKAADTQVQYEQLKLMALTLTALTETRYAYSHYETLRTEYNVAHKQTINAEEIFKLDKDRNRAALASDQQVIIAKLHTLTARMDEDLLLSDLSTSLGELYASVGLDMLPTNLESRPLNEITDVISKNFKQQTPWDFSSYVNYSYNKIFSEMNNTMLAKNAEPENQSAVLETVNSISQGSPGDPIGMRMLTLNSKKQRFEKLAAPKIETQLAAKKPTPSLFAALSKLVPHQTAPTQVKPELKLAAKKAAPAPTEYDAKIAALKIENNSLKAQLDGEQNLEMLENKAAAQKRIVTNTKVTTKPTTTVAAKKAADVPKPFDVNIASTQINSKLTNKTFVTALLNNANAKIKTVSLSTHLAETKTKTVTQAQVKDNKVVSVAKNHEPKKQVVAVAKKEEPKKQIVAVTKKEEPKKQIVVVAKQEEPKKQVVAVAKKEEPKKQVVAVAKKEEPKKQVVAVAKKEEPKKQVVAVAKKEEPKKQVVAVTKRPEPKKQLALKTEPAVLVNKKVSTIKPAEQAASDDDQPNKSFVTALLTDQNPDEAANSSSENPVGPMLASK
jgi:multidrug efflux system outer membrane protein